MSDAGQFGANQAYSAVVATIVAFAQKTTRRRLFFLAVAGLGFIGDVPVRDTRGHQHPAGRFLHSLRPAEKYLRHGLRCCPG